MHDPRSKYLFLDVEATGPGTHVNHSILEIGAEVWQNGKKLGEIEVEMLPDKDVIYHKKLDGTMAHEDRARRFINEGRPSQSEGFSTFLEWCSEYVNVYDKKDKFTVISYGARWEERHMTNWFKKQKNKWIGSYFHAPFICLQQLHVLLHGSRLWTLVNRQLSTLATSLGVEVDHLQLHTALYDAQLARKVFFNLLN